MKNRRYDVGEIKSTLDIVMEKTKHLILSKEEKQHQKNKEAKQNLSGLLQKYQDTLINFERLKDMLKELQESYDYIDTQTVVREVLARIDLDHDNTSLIIILDKIGHVDTGNLKKVLSDYRDTVRIARNKSSDQAKEKLANEYHISGTAVLPIIATDDKLRAYLLHIRTEFLQRLNREKAALAKE
jgi:hypothetical protein